MKKVLLLLSILIVGVMGMMVGKFLYDRQDDYTVDTSGVEIPHFKRSDIPFAQGNDFSISLPFMASAIIDIDGDGTEELFLGGSAKSDDGLFRFQNRTLNPIKGAGGITKGKVASYGAVALDVNHDGKSDLIVAREDGIWLHLNRGSTFSNQKLPITMPKGSVPLSVAVADLNRDGAFDLYVAGYIRHDLVEGQNIFREGYGGESRLFLNNGDNTFKDITQEAGVAYKHNTFGALFIDVDQDGLEDLVVVHDTGHVMTWKNMGNLHFKKMQNPNSNTYSYPMGIGVTDLGNDGLPDFFFSNVGSTPPNFMVRGDLREDQTSNWKWMLFKNLGGFRFEDVADKMKIADYEFSWGGVFEDLNLDGLDDLIVSENYIGLPPYRFKFLRLNGRLLLQTPKGVFAPAGKKAGVINRYFSISPLTADFNHDGYPDIVHANLNDNSKLFLSQGGDAHYLKVKLPDTLHSIGATVEVKLSDGKVLRRPFVVGEGLCSDSSHIITFGLGKKAKATEVSVHYLDGTQLKKSGTFKDSTLVFE